ncbi:TA system VapC family ribonuclease toxin [Paraburkholderia fungorum]|uniref:Ribonuclease VapC n=1 Tax=Paraburkholderia fungorum TaxID=134537 RepID=A0AAP5QIB0_9BURK|nr:TA system VapC family ribonuclease toxin [Paraburkholderia fungorum]MBU7442667.1 PIN domain-containing protein [Paraburkholderia fungorum]MDT8843993.1 PIN domain-containing protein [Paraburkholderia fungorum]
MAASTSTTYLLDVNVLIALLDPAHVQHDTAHDWFAKHGEAAWATCPLTENGVLRIIGHARYPNTPGSPAAVAPLVAQLRQRSGHVFWPDDLSLVDPAWVDASRLLSAGQVTDSYLLALACAHGGQLASFDRRLVTDAVLSGDRSLHLIG